MRKDINVNTNTHDIVLHNQRLTVPYRVIWQQNNDNIMLGTVSVPSALTEEIKAFGFAIYMPYTPIYKPVRLQVIFSDCVKMYDLYKKITTSEDTRIYASSLIIINQDERYVIQPTETKAYVYSYDDSDLQITNADIQNRNLLLQCIPGNSYRYPLSGVGLVRYLHANLEHSDLGERLQSEFKKDGMIVNNADFDVETGYMDLDLEHLKTY